MTTSPDPGSTPPSPTPPGGGAPLGYGTVPAGPVYEGPPPGPDARTMGMLAHLLGIFTLWLGPLIVWLAKKDTSPFVDDQGKEALNWEITIFLPVFALMALRVLTCFVSIPFTGCLTSILWLAVMVVNLVFAIQGAMAANKGIAFRYPFSLRLVK